MKEIPKHLGIQVRSTQTWLRILTYQDLINFCVVSTKEHLIYYDIHCCMNYHQKHIRCAKPTVKLKKHMNKWYFTSNINFPDILCLHPRHRPLPTHPLGAPFELTSMVCIRLSRVFMPCSTCQALSGWHQKASSNPSEECHTLRSTKIAGWNTTMV